MNILDEILDRYQSADMGHRLNMYLQYRDHRDEFLMIDMDHCENEPEEVRSFSCFRNFFKDGKVFSGNAGGWPKIGDGRKSILTRSLNMSFSSAQSFVQKMKEDKKFRESFQLMPDRKKLWNCIREEGYNFDEKDLVRAMAECMNEMEASC